MAKAKPLPVYLVLRKLVDPATGQPVAAFVPASDADRAILREREYRFNARIRAELKQPRNERFNRLVHGLGWVLADSLDRFAGKTAHEAIKALQAEAVVCCDVTVTDIPGFGRITHHKPQSLSFDRMSEEVFQDFWAKCCEYLIQHDWPTLTEDRLAEMAEFESFRGAA